jgi:hypothetical protein
VDPELVRAIETLDTADPAEVAAFQEARKRELEAKAKERADRVKAEASVAAKLDERTRKVLAQLEADEAAARLEAARMVAEAQLRAEAGLDHHSVPVPAKVTLGHVERARHQHLGG